MQKQILLLIILATMSTQIELSIQLQNYQRWCFFQFITQSTPYHIKITASTSPKYEFSHLFKNGKILYKNPNQTVNPKKFDSYSQISDQFEFCIENLAAKQQFHIEYFEGIELSDEEQIPGELESAKIDREIEEVNRFFLEVKEREHYSMTINQYNMELQKMVSFKSVGFGFLAITIVIIISFLHYLEIKRVLHNRKII